MQMVVKSYTGAGPLVSGTGVDLTHLIPTSQNQMSEYDKL